MVVTRVRTILRAWAGHPPISLGLATVAIFVASIVAQRTLADDRGTWQDYRCPSNATGNPCTYSTCRTVNDTCETGGVVTAIWTVTVNGPSQWLRCNSASGSFYTPQCLEAKRSCGTTMHYLYNDPDNGCWGPCSSTGYWQACRAVASSNCANPGQP